MEGILILVGICRLAMDAVEMVSCGCRCCGGSDNARPAPDALTGSRRQMSIEKGAVTGREPSAPFWRMFNNDEQWP